VERDTSPEAHRVQLDVLRRLGERGRGAMAVGMTEDIREVVRLRIAREQPNLDERGIARALVAVLYGEQLAVKAFAR